MIQDGSKNSKEKPVAAGVRAALWHSLFHFISVEDSQQMQETQQDCLQWGNIAKSTRHSRSVITPSVDMVTCYSSCTE